MEVFQLQYLLKIFIRPLPEGRGGYTVLPLSFRPSKIFFVAFFSVTVDGRNLLFGHKHHIGIPYCGQRFWTRQIPTSCLPTQLVSIHIEHICSFFVAFFSATIDGRNLIFGHKLHIGTPYRGKCFLTRQIPTSCLPKSRGIISSSCCIQEITVLYLKISNTIQLSPF